MRMEKRGSLLPKRQAGAHLKSATDYIRDPAMLYDKERHPEWDWSPNTKRNVSISVAIVLALLVLKSLIVGPGPRVVQEDEHYRVEIVRST
jgi:hypothetical protein